MKTRSSDERARHGLPPAPAPPSRDANPWKMSSPPGSGSHAPRHARAPGGPPAPHAPDERIARRAGRLPWIPLLILFVILGTSVQSAIHALQEGDVERAIGALAIMALVAAVALRRILKSKE